MAMLAGVKEALSNSYDELVNNVSWPSLRELSQTAVLVLVASLIIALVVFGMDEIVETVLKFIYNN